MSLFDVYMAVDWSARNVPSPKKPTADALWVGECLAHQITGEETCNETYWRTRHECVAFLRERLLHHIDRERRVLIGFDFGFSYPAGFADALDLQGDTPPWRRIWDMLAGMIEDRPDNSNNRFTVAAELNARCGEAIPGPFWGCPVGVRLPLLLPTSPVYPYPVRHDLVLQRLRKVDARERAMQPAWKLYGTASVGSQMLVGIPYVRRLRDDPALSPLSRIWPFEIGFTARLVPARGPSILFVEIWPGIVSHLLDPAIAIRDRAQVRAMVRWFAELDAAGLLGKLFDVPEHISERQLQQCIEEEGWVLGAGVYSRKKTS